MRLHRLELEGFGPFREKQSIDFDAFAGDGIFLIAGRTGAGKSSVLDGVCFALYGGAPRYDGGKDRLRSDHCAPEDPTSVTVEFSAAGSRWRVVRSPEYDRPKQRGTGLTTEPHRARLDELVDGEWVGRAARPVDVARELDEILGLSQQQFLQVILLAQNRFAEFLLAKNDERQRLLRRLFGTRTYEDYQAALEQRRKGAERSLAVAGDAIGLLLDEAERTIADVFDGADLLTRGDVAAEPDVPAALDVPARSEVPARLRAAELGVQRAAYRVERLESERGDADAAHEAASIAYAAAAALREKQERRRRARSALAALEEKAPRIGLDRTTLERAAAAEALRAPIETAARASREAAEAESAAERARADWSRVVRASSLGGPRGTDADAAGAGEFRGAAGADSGSADAAALCDIVDELTGALAIWSEAAVREDALGAAEERLFAARAAIAILEGVISERDAERSLLPSRLAAIDTELEPARVLAAGHGGAASAVAAAAERLVAARDAERLAGALVDAEAAYLAAADAHDVARREVTSLLRRRLAGHAGELAAALVDGEPCAVCGSTDHPRPAHEATDPVTDDEIAAAELARDRAAAAEGAAEGAARTARDEHAAAAARSGGVSADELESVHAAAEAALAVARDAVVRRDRLTVERRDIAERGEAAVAERGRLAAELAAAREELAKTEAIVDRDRRAVAAARGGFDTVHARIADATVRRAAASALVDALARLGAASHRADETASDRDARVAASAFADADDARGALRSVADRGALDERIREHEAALRSERDRLRDLELALAGEPEELVDVVAAAAAASTARERWSAAVDAAATAHQAARRLSDIVARAASHHASLADLAADHAVIARLADTVSGRAPNTRRMTLESFVLAAELEEIVAAANVRLDEMSSGRYRLLHTDALAARGAASGLGLEILDAHTGQPRSAHSLSGGETFLASLALALGLAEVVTARAGGVRLDTLFIDEGFGSLDDHTLELAMRTLDELRQGGRTVGVISHVAAMKEQLPAQLVVEATHQGPSIIRQDSAASVSA